MPTKRLLTPFRGLLDRITGGSEKEKEQVEPDDTDVTSRQNGTAQAAQVVVSKEFRESVSPVDAFEKFLPPAVQENIRALSDDPENIVGFRTLFSKFAQENPLFLDGIVTYLSGRYIKLRSSTSTELRDGWQVQAFDKGSLNSEDPQVTVLCNMGSGRTVTGGLQIKSVTLRLVVPYNWRQE